MDYGCLSMDWSALQGTLYGRDDSMLQLKCAYERCLQSNAPREIVLITGPSGVGKSALALSLKDRVITEEHGFFLTGKFDQVAATNLLTAKSYGPFVEAFTEYSNQVANAGDNVLLSLRQALLTAMSRSELLVLLEMIPALNKILRFRNDEHHSSIIRPIMLRGADAEGRFTFIFCRFVQTIASQRYPIVILLDDIQWLNPSSLALLKAIAEIDKEKTKCQLLIICTCRNDENQPSDQTSCDIHDGDYQVTTIMVSSLDRESLYTLVSDVLPLDCDQKNHFTNMIYSRTRGNAFHLLQLLKLVEKEGLPLPSLLEGDETCNIHDRPSIVQLLNRRIENLPDKVKDALKVAACLGCVFSDACLVAGVFLPESDILAAISLCEKEGIIVRIDAHTFRFTHDKFQQSVYMMIPDESKDKFHLNVGLRLWHWLPFDSRDDHLLLMGDQICRGIHLLNDKEERDELAKLFLHAGRKAARGSSFSAAAAYLKCGINLLNTKHWKKQYRLSLMLYNTAAEIEYYCGNFERVDALVAEVFRQAQSFDDTLVARFTRIYSLGSRCEMVQALEEGFVVLEHLEEPLPRRVGYLQVATELTHCKWILCRMTEQALLESPVLTDTKKLTALRLMIIMHAFAFNRGNKCGPIIAARAVRMCFRNGISELSCAGFAIMALVFATRGDVVNSYRCSRFALTVFARYQSTEWQARLSVAVYAFAFPFKHRLRDSIAPLLAGHRSGLVLGDIHFSILCSSYHCLIRFYAGDPLPEVLDAAMNFRKVCEQYGQRFVTPNFAILIQLILNLMGESSDPLVLSGRSMKEEDAFNVWQSQNPISFLLFLNCKHFLAVYMNEHVIARRLADEINRAKARLLPIAQITHWFLQAVASVTAAQRQLYLRQLKQAAHHCPDNFLHKVYMVEAELANHAGSHDEALAKYVMSIEHADRHGFLQEQALACERTANALHDRGKYDEAAKYFAHARSLYREWGAQIKVDQLANNRLN